MTEQKTHICCITETWLGEKNFDPNELSLGGYFSVYACNRQGGSKGGGCLTLIDINLVSREIYSRSYLNHEIFITDIISSHPIRIITLYRPPG